MMFLLQLFGGRGSGSSRRFLHRGKQGKHWPWHNNFQDNKSIVDIDPETIEQLVEEFAENNHGQRETIDFGRIIGQWLNPRDGQYYDTTRGTIHWAEDGSYHIVPAPPSEFL